MPALFGTTVTSPLFGVEVPVLAHPLAEMDKGAGIAMCCTFGDLTDVQWWRELELPTRSVMTRDGRIQAETPEWITCGPGEQLFGELATKTTLLAPARAVVDALARVGRPRRRARSRPSARRTSTRRATSRSRSSRRASGTSATAAATPSCDAALLERGRELDFHPGVHAGPLRELGRRPQRRLADQPPAVLRRADPRLVPLDAEGEADYDHPIVPDRGRAAGRPGGRGAAPATTSRSAAGRAASSATPTSWTPGPRRR